MKLADGYYWYREKYGQPTPWRICWAYNGFVHFFGQVSQKIDCDYLNRYVEFGPAVEPMPI